MAITSIRKRDGRIVKFDQGKITDAVFRALFEFNKKDHKLAKRISNKAVIILEKKGKTIPDVEMIQDSVEEAFKKSGLKSIAESYGEYRDKKAHIRNLIQTFGIKSDMKLTYNALTLLEERYLLKNSEGRIIETPQKMFRRVANAIASVDKKFEGYPSISEEIFYGMMSRLEFLPNSPTLFNAGAPLKQLSACFVLDIKDSLDSIFDAVKQTAMIEQTGGGVGFSFSKLRPKGDIVRSTKGVASGPVSFMRVFDIVTDVIKAGGKRRGAMMGMLDVDHPDILRFINAKREAGMLSNFNISVAVTDKFMKAVKSNRSYDLINPRTNKSEGKLNAKYVWGEIIKSAWATGDPGVFFLDEVNRHNPTPELGKIKCSNPCGEVPLLPNESCNLGSINISKFASDGEIEWKKLGDTVKNAVHFLDNVIEANVFPTKEIETMTKSNRKIGLGLMGWAELLIKLKIRYDSKQAVTLAENVMKFIDDEAKKASEELGKKRGSFPNFKGSTLAKKHSHMRNATCTTIAPTGSISIIAGCSSGIEPLFAVSFVRNVLGGKRLLEVNPLFERISKERGFYSAQLLTKIINTGSIRMKDIPTDVKSLFVTALDIKPEWHVRMQAAFQKHTDNAVSKTINLPNNATVSDVKKSYELAHKLKCKGITIYRYGSKEKQVLYIGPQKSISAEPEFSGGCPTGICQF